MINEYLRVFRAFTDKNRIQILELLCGGEQCACILLDNLKISQPTLSHHMKILCRSGIVKSRRVGPWNYYSINKDGCTYASRLLTMIAQKELGSTVKFLKMLYRPIFLLSGKYTVNTKGHRTASGRSHDTLKPVCTCRHTTRT